MIPSTTSSTSPQSARHAQFSFTASISNNTTFAFHTSPRPVMKLTFPPRPSPPRPRKRGRAVTDIDGEHSCLFKKKRRLRLFLITSRLSPQYSHPATNIVDRGSSKIAVWAKQKSLGRNLLRKAAILNQIRRRAISVTDEEEELGRISVNGEREQKQLQLARLALVYGSHDSFTRPPSKLPPARTVGKDDPFAVPTTPSSTTSPIVTSDHDEITTSEYRSPNDAYSYSPPKAQISQRSYLPLPPSPLGLSNYDAFDLEDDYDPYAHLKDDEESDMDDARSPPANTSVSYKSPLFTAAIGTREAMTTPPQLTFCDFNVLDPEEPVMGDYDQVDEGADTVWPNPSTERASSQQPLPASSSPNFSVLLATSPVVDGPFSPNFTTTLPEEPTGGQWRVSGIAGKEKDIDLQQERSRQRNLMFLRFKS